MNTTTMHTFECSDTPGTFECPTCEAWAHFDRDEERYCVHPADQDELAFLVGTWDDERVRSAHA